MVKLAIEKDNYDNLHINFYCDDVRIYCKEYIPNLEQIVESHYKEFGI